MTIRISIKNEDNGERSVLVSQQTLGSDNLWQAPHYTKLSGGESAEVYVHGNNQVLITEEKQN